MTTSTPVPEPSGTAAVPDARVVRAGAFDIRNFIATLIGLYGVILTLWGLVAFGADEAAKTGGVNANLWTGLAMLAAAALFALWARFDPIRIRVPEDGGAPDAL